MKNKVILNKEVIKVKWNETPVIGAPDILVECSDGSSYTADHAIITFSLGVFKEKAEKMFIPSLPKEKTDSIKVSNKFELQSHVSATYNLLFIYRAWVLELWTNYF